jgi:hypothetical protein
MMILLTDQSWGLNMNTRHLCIACISLIGVSGTLDAHAQSTWSNVPLISSGVFSATAGDREPE